MEYVPAGVPCGFCTIVVVPRPPPPPQPQSAASSSRPDKTSAGLRLLPGARRWRRLMVASINAIRKSSGSKSRLFHGPPRKSITAAVRAVVLIVKVTPTPPTPAGTVAGLKVQVEAVGNPLQLMVAGPATVHGFTLSN